MRWKRPMRIAPPLKRFAGGGNSEHDALLEEKIFPIVRLSAEIGRLHGELKMLGRNYWPGTATHISFADV